MAYFENPDNKNNWEQELRQLKVEKARRAGGYVGEFKREETPFRISITFDQLLAMDQGEKHTAAMSRTMEKQTEKSMKMEGISL